MSTTRLAPGPGCGCTGACPTTCFTDTLNWDTTLPINVSWTDDCGNSGSTTMTYSPSVCGGSPFGFTGTIAACAGCSPADDVTLTFCCGNTGSFLSMTDPSGVGCAEQCDSAADPTWTASPPMIAWTAVGNYCANFAFTPVPLNCEATCGANYCGLISITISQ